MDNETLQKFIDGQMSKMRDENLSQSGQLLLGEIKLKLEAIVGKEKPIVFDFGMKPAGACSWRGSYCELSLKYSENGGGYADWDTDKIEEKIDDYTFFEKESYTIPENPTVQDFLGMLNALTGKTMSGYKGGDFVMHKNVAVYFGNYGSSSVENYKNKDYATVAPFDIIESEDIVTIITNEVDY